jgi:hypothetical protein
MEIVGGFFIAGLLLWWIIKSDLMDLAQQKQASETMAKMHAAAQADYLAALKIFRDHQAFHDRRERHLKLIQKQCAEAQDAQGLLPVATISKTLGSSAYAYTTAGGRTTFYGTICGSNGEYYVNVDPALDAIKHKEHEHPFPGSVNEGFFRASDVIKWIEERHSEFRLYPPEPPTPV